MFKKINICISVLLITIFCFSCAKDEAKNNQVVEESSIVNDEAAKVEETKVNNVDDIPIATEEIKKQDKSIHNFGKLFLIGDSNFDSNFYLNVGHKFFYDFFDYNEYDSLTNLSKEGAGLTVGWKYENSEEWKLPPHYISIDYVEEDTDILLLYTSFNDVYSNGDMGVKTNTLPNTVYGALNFINGRIKEKLPNTKVLFISPMKWPLLEKSEETQRHCEKYVSIIESYAKEHDYLYLDLYHDSLAELDSSNYMFDSIHVNEKTQEEFVYPRIKEMLYRCCMK